MPTAVRGGGAASPRAALVAAKRASRSLLVHALAACSVLVSQRRIETSALRLAPHRTAACPAPPAASPVVWWAPAASAPLDLNLVGQRAAQRVPWPSGCRRAAHAPPRGACHATIARQPARVRWRRCRQRRSGRATPGPLGATSIPTAADYGAPAAGCDLVCVCGCAGSARVPVRGAGVSARRAAPLR